jgi:hypothetical protein
MGDSIRVCRLCGKEVKWCDCWFCHSCNDVHLADQICPIWTEAERERREEELEESVDRANRMYHYVHDHDSAKANDIQAINHFMSFFSTGLNKRP